MSDQKVAALAIAIAVPESQGIGLRLFPTTPDSTCWAKADAFLREVAKDLPPKMRIGLPVTVAFADNTQLSVEVGLRQSATEHAIIVARRVWRDTATAAGLRRASGMSDTALAQVRAHTERCQEAAAFLATHDIPYSEELEPLPAPNADATPGQSEIPTVFLGAFDSPEPAS